MNLLLDLVPLEVQRHRPPIDPVLRVTLAQNGWRSSELLERGVPDAGPVAPRVVPAERRRAGF